MLKYIWLKTVFLSQMERKGCLEFQESLSWCSEAHLLGYGRVGEAHDEGW